MWMLKLSNDFLCKNRCELTNSLVCFSTSKVSCPLPIQKCLLLTDCFISQYYDNPCMHITIKTDVNQLHSNQWWLSLSLFSLLLLIKVVFCYCFVFLHILIVLYWLWAGVATLLLFLFVCCVETSSRHIRGIEKGNIDFITWLNQELNTKRQNQPFLIRSKSSVHKCIIFVSNISKSLFTPGINTCLGWTISTMNLKT